MPEPVSIELRISGLRAVIEEDRWYPGSYRLIVDGTPQSHVHPDEPTELYFEYVRRIGHVIDQLRPPGEPLTAVHFGAGAFTLPRYIEATRPGSRQQVVELERDLVDFVREQLPLPKDASIRIRYGDAREIAGKLPGGLKGSADLVIVDIFSGARTPGHVTSIEFYSEVIGLLKPDGVLAVNVADGPGMSFARGQASTLSLALPHVAVLAEAQVLKGRRYGNFVLIASPTQLPLEWVPRLLAAGPHPSRVVFGRELRDWIAGAPVVTDATAVPSPPPGRTVFQVGRGGS